MPRLVLSMFVSLSLHLLVPAPLLGQPMIA